MTDPTWLAEDAPVVELITKGRAHERPRIGEDKTIRRVTQTLVITNDGAKYNRQYLRPVSEGRYSDRRLVSAHDPRVTAIRGRQHLEQVARLASNLAALDRDTPEDVVSALAQIVAAAAESRGAVVALMVAATVAARP